MNNMLGKISRFGRMQQKKNFVFEIFIFFEIFWRKSGILILDLYLQCKYTTQYYKKLLEKYFWKSQFFKKDFWFFWFLIFLLLLFCPLELWTWIIIHVHCSFMNSGTLTGKTKNQGKGSGPPGVAVMADWRGRMTWIQRWKRRWGWLQVAGAAAAGRGRKGSNLQRGERRSRWLITDTVVAGRWSWQHVVVLVAHGGTGGRDVDGGGRKKKKQKKKVCSGEK